MTEKNDPLGLNDEAVSGSSRSLDSATIEYAYDINKKMKSNLMSFVRIHLVIYLIRFSAIAFEATSTVVTYLLIPYLIVAIIALVAIMLYLMWMLEGKEGERKDIDSQARIANRIRVTGFIDCLIILSAIAVIEKLEEDFQIRLIGNLVLMALVCYAHYYWLRSLPLFGSVIGAFLGMFWWCCGRHCQKPFLLTSFVFFFIGMGFYIIEKALAKEANDFYAVWQLKRDKNLYEQFLMIIHDPVIILERKKLLFSNSAASVLKLTGENYTSRLSHFVNSGNKSILDLINEVFNSKEDVCVPEAEYVNRDNNASEALFYKVYITVSTYKSKKKALAVIFKSIKDMTRDKVSAPRFEQEQQVIVHFMQELKVPLSYVHGLLQCAKQVKDGDSDLKMKLTEGKAWCTYIGNEIDNIIKYLQIWQNSVAFHPVTVDIKRMLTRTIKVAYLLLDDKRESVEILLTEGVKLLTHAIIDLQITEQILTNILMTAVKMIEKGKIEVQVWHTESEKMLEFEIIYSGNPPKKDLLESLCYDRKGEQEVANLQLLASNFLCKQIKGSLGVNCDAKSTVISLRIPYIPAENNTATQSFPVLPDDTEEHKLKVDLKIPMMRCNPALFSGAHIHRSDVGITIPSAIAEKPFAFMIVDWMGINRYTLSRKLNKLRYNPIKAKMDDSGLKEASKVLKDSGAKGLIVFIEISSPVEKATSFCSMLRAECKGRNIFFIATAAFLEERTRKVLKDFSIDHCLGKPVKKSEIKQLVERFSALYSPSMSSIAK